MTKELECLKKKLLYYISKRYISHYWVLTVDTLISMVCMFVALELICLLTNVPIYWNAIMFPMLAVSIVLSVACSLCFKTHRHIIRYMAIGSLWCIAASILIQAVCLFLTMSSMFSFVYYGHLQCFSFLLFFVALAMLGLIGIRVAMIIIYNWLGLEKAQKFGIDAIVVFGVDSVAVSLEMRVHGSKHYRVVGFITARHENVGKCKIASLPVLKISDGVKLKRFFQLYNVKGILVSQQELKESKDCLVKICEEMGVRALVAPNITDSPEHISHKQIHDVRIEDLLGRDEIKINLKNIIANFNGKVIMVTGAAGSIGSELCRQLATFGVKHLILFDNSETPLHNLRLELEHCFPNLKFTPVIGDVRSPGRLNWVFKNFMPQVVFHAAAYKHVPLMEENPCEAILVNVLGTRQVADMCVKYKVEKMVMISTDKAVNPSSLMGASKRLAEIYVQSLGLALKADRLKGTTMFVTTRFGNVLGSNGSVIPYFREEIKNGGPVTVTHKDIIRYFMTIPEACQLVMEAATMGHGSDIYVFDMGKPVKILDLAERMISLAGLVPYVDIPIVFTGLRPGEKLYEELLSNEENTLPTSHDKIRVAKVRSYDYETILPQYKKLVKLALDIRVDETVKLMKDIVPEYQSMNSVFERLNHKCNVVTG